MQPQIKAQIRPELWSAIEASYNAGKYTSAVQDTFFFLSELIREKADLQADGASLIDAAFSPKNPIIKVADDSTETGKNLIQGTHQILRGLYLAIRNPRAHEKFEDKQSQADAIILFVNFLIDPLDKARGAFSLDTHLKMVFDDHFHESDRYGSLLAEKIPKKLLLETFREVLAKSEDLSPSKMRFYLPKLMELMSEDDRVEAYTAIGDYLSMAYPGHLIGIIGSFPVDNWIKYPELSRLRAEGIILEDIYKGSLVPGAKEPNEGWIGVWAISFIFHFADQKSILNRLQERLMINDFRVREYIYEYFFKYLTENSIPTKAVSICLKKLIKEGDRSTFYAIKGSAWEQHFEWEIVEFSPEADNPVDDLPF